MAKRKNKDQNKKKKVNLVFDESKRKEFLCGFRKRKLERKKKAQEELQRLLKDEKKRIKQENKESYKKLVVSSRPIPDIEQLLQEEYEDDDVNVKIIELSSDTLQKKNLFIGENKPKQEQKQHTQENIVKKKKNGALHNVPGMGSDEESEAEKSESEEKEKEDTLKTKKEVKKMLKKQATTKIQKSKVFQMKSKLDRIKNKKKSQQKKAHMKGKAKGNQQKEKSKRNVGRRKH